MKLPSEVLLKFCTETRAHVEEKWLYFPRAVYGMGLRLTGNDMQYSDYGLTANNWGKWNWKWYVVEGLGPRTEEWQCHYQYAVWRASLKRNDGQYRGYGLDYISGREIVLGLVGSYSWRGMMDSIGATVEGEWCTLKRLEWKGCARTI